MYMGGSEEKDMFSADVLLASQENEVIENAMRQVASQPASEVVAGSSGAPPETFRDESPSECSAKKQLDDSINSKKPPVSKPQQWEKRQQKGLRAPRVAPNNLLKVQGPISSNSFKPPLKVMKTD